MEAVNPVNPVNVTMSEDVTHAKLGDRKATIKYDFDSKEVSAAGPTLKHACIVFPGTFEGFSALTEVASQILEATNKNCSGLKNLKGKLEETSNILSLPGTYKSGLETIKAATKVHKGEALGFVKSAAKTFASGVKSVKVLTQLGFTSISESTQAVLNKAGKTAKFAVEGLNTFESAKKIKENNFIVKEEKTSEILNLAASVSVIAFSVFTAITTLFALTVPAIVTPVLLTTMIVALTVKGIYKVHTDRVISEYIANMLNN